jgi:hypothetical protein
VLFSKDGLTKQIDLSLLRPGLQIEILKTELEKKLQRDMFTLNLDYSYLNEGKGIKYEDLVKCIKSRTISTNNGMIKNFSELSY